MVTISIDDREVRETLGRIAARARNMRPLMRDIAGIMKSAVQENFIREGRPDRWTPSKRAKKQGGQTLRDSGRLFKSITGSSDESSAQVGTNVKYAAIHHFGGDIRQHARTELFTRNRYVKGDKKGQFKKGTKAGRGLTLSGRTITMPPRPYMHLEPADLRRILDAARQYLGE